MIKPKKFETTIKIRVVGSARIYKDDDGTSRAEIEYDIEDMGKQIDKCLLPFLEEVVGFKHARVNGKLIPTGGVLVSFRCSLMSDCPWYRSVVERAKKEE